MPSGISRRDLLRGIPLLLVSKLPQAEDVRAASGRLQAVEARGGVRLGVAALDTGNGRRINYHANERWPLCSTFKVLLVGAVLATVDSGRERLDRAIRYNQHDLLGYAPIARENLARGQMTVGELCRAAVCYSDNTAANLLFPVVGGPAGLTHDLRSLGDRTTNINRTEPSLNESLPCDVRDTTSASAMVHDIEKLLLDEALAEVGRIIKTAMAKASHSADSGLRFPWTRV